MITEKHKSVIVQTVCNLIIPFIQVFAIYVVMHGHYGPGGGFQGGVLLAVSVILQRLYLGKELSLKRFPRTLAPVFAAVGLLVFGLAGVIPLFSGGSFLDYAYLMLPWAEGAQLRYLGIQIVEIGIALGVFGTMVLIFDNLAGERW